ncbi:MAG TPA: hypothetical protein DHW42_03920 [Candidatus Marinimicrobia bacterium]|nr:hypothetical protein [Candidatus Neomarinimicrobiota bacterium]
MKSEYREYLQKITAFNRWESMDHRNRSAGQNLEQFVTLYDLGRYFSDDQKNRSHREHLNRLIEVQEQLRKGAK